MLFLVLAFFAITALLLYLDSRKPKGFPPGPDWLPILGSARELAQLRKETGYLYKACEELVHRYGPVVGLRVGKDRQVIVSGYEAIREMSSRDDFDGRPRGPLYETRTFNLRRGLLLTDSDFWLEQRKFVIRHLREFGFGRRGMAGMVQDEAGELVRAFEEKLRASPEGAIAPMHDAFGLYVLNTLWTMLASIRYTPEDTELVTLQALLNDLFTRLDMAGALFSQFPILQYIAPDASGYTEFVTIHQRLWKFLRDEMDRHIETYDPNEMRDFMDVYIKMIKEAGPNSSFTELQLLAICMDMFMAGSETTSKSLGFGFLYLLRHPEVQKRVQEELDAVVGSGRAPELADRPK
ncbi:methyl farnesoate epoxidase [Frankliniella occidentalis]|uniref:Methyl farnesoate epoxidase n=1 Tax=Frankliniella occidentalis TaxID=133901 RepID=A0A9C6XCH4_FRAOC|nr:methyl farnesoate epoxidase [Frankliniella occidentalis]